MKISLLPLLANPTGAEQVPVVAGGLTRRLSITAIAELARAILPVIAKGQDGNPGAPGQPGGNVEASGPFKDLGSTPMPAGAKALSTSGSWRHGVGGARYYEDLEQTALTARSEVIRSGAVQAGVPAATALAAVTAMQERFRRAAQDGRYFVCRDPLTPEQIMLTLDTPAQRLQALADLNSFWRLEIRLPYARYLANETIFLTHGLGWYTSCHWRGAGDCFEGVDYDASDGLPMIGGTVISTNRLNIPLLAVQGGRRVEITDQSLACTVGIRGHVVANNLGSANVNLSSMAAANGGVEPSDRDRATWFGNGVVDQRHAVQGAIVVEPLADAAPSGPAPTSPYSPLPTPAFLPQQQYGRSLTTDLKVERVAIDGFAAAIVVHSSPGPHQSDFVHGRDLLVQRVVDVLSIGGHQSRAVDWNQVNCGKSYCAVTNRRHGARVGHLNSTLSHWSLSEMIKWLDLSGAAGSMIFQSCYSEDTDHIGDIPNGGSADGVVSFTHCKMSHGGRSARRGQPGYQLGAGPDAPRGNGTTRVTFSGGNLQVHRFAPIMFDRFEADKEWFIQVEEVDESASSGVRPSLGRAIAHNGSFGLGLPLGYKTRDHVIKSYRWNLDYRIDPTPGSQLHDPVNILAAGITDGEFRGTSRRTCIPYWLRRAVPRLHLDDRYAVVVPRRHYEIPKTYFSNRAANGKRVTMTAPSGATPVQAQRTNAMGTGTICYETTVARWFYVDSWDYTTGAVTLEALGAYRDLGAGDVLYPAYDLDNGEFLFLETRFYTPDDVLLGDVAAGSNQVTNLRNHLGETGWIGPKTLGVGDVYDADPSVANPLFAPGTVITAYDPVAKTVTLSTGANRAATGHRYELFLRHDL